METRRTTDNGTNTPGSNDLDALAGETASGCGRPGPLALPGALEIVALLLIWPGPASGELWFVKGVVVGVGGLILSLGIFVARLALLTRLGAFGDDSLVPGLFTEVAAARAGEAGEIAILRGRAELGPAEHDDALLAPLSDRPCLAFTLAVYRLWETGADFGASSRMIQSTNRSTPFWLVDRTGRIRVDPTGAQVTGVPGQVTEVDAADEQGMRDLEGRLEALGVKVRRSWTARTIGYTFEEEIVPLDAELTVVGPLVDRAGERLVAARRSHGPFSIDAVEPTVAGAMRRMVRKVRVAGVVVPLVGLAMVVGGFWWVLTG